MLSQDDQRRLADIERRLERDDPAFAARMRARAGGRRHAVVFIGGGLLALTPMIGSGMWLGRPVLAALVAGLAVGSATIMIRFFLHRRPRPRRNA